MHFPVPLQPNTLHTAQHIHLNPADVHENHTRGHGHGGQKKNKSCNCVELTHKPSGVVVRVDHHRHLSDNREEAWQLLIEKVEEHTVGNLEEKEREIYHEMKAESRRSKGGHELSQEARTLQQELNVLEEQKHAIEE
ncbi:hypothetical protein COU78_04590 [Candidatus Peregrinibacteria bacterium CG10_big_fil_rev_8_21_14_0_10_49_24]|nr:MAG: hypothetical protein COV83_06615 [Candidatus Peregrinibacteria bacterium CG11_big_fil_rev_8_21_14_0_20_49_14]PIR50798.1 MAG: hypothetical protein COU78_04590 [Candidatus Peregrinibacteria bacterium CG10_big_fil_rev_8_21_14_0_10_49_24]PJA67796.1 MAG: hypothetical protein CO157_02715 [Candidatus Peregrinibacteria bacterium CG_4_9_14_3_um_filter_49_12]